MQIRSVRRALVAGCALFLPFVFLNQAKGSDHADTQEIVRNPGLDITDVFVFPSAENPNNVVLAMDVHGLIATNQWQNVGFDPNVLYQIKIDNSSSSSNTEETLVIQASFEGTGSGQTFSVRGPVAPTLKGNLSKVVTSTTPVQGRINQTVTAGSMKVFCGAREDPFFFDLDRFYAIFPDRKTPLTDTPVANPNTPQLASWRSPAEAVDFLAGLNCLSIVVEVPRSMLTGTAGSKIKVWATTSRANSRAKK